MSTYQLVRSNFQRRASLRARVMPARHAGAWPPATQHGEHRRDEAWPRTVMLPEQRYQSKFTIRYSGYKVAYWENFGATSIYPKLASLLVN